MNIRQIQAKKNKEKLSVLTAYSAPVAEVLENAEIDMILVGDSLGMVFQGKENTLAVTVEEMIYHAKAVRAGAKKSFMIVDMPFMSYQVNAEETLVNAGRIMKETNANAVKLEGAGNIVIDAVKKCIAAGIPVMGHIGFTPQSVNQLAGYKVQGRDKNSADKLLFQAKELEKAGVFSIVLEMVPEKIATVITTALNIPTISCGAGVDCDGQVLVIDDMLGLYPSSPKFARKYIDLKELISKAVNEYTDDVRDKKFPTKEESF